MADSIPNIFSGLKSPRDVSKYSLMRGVTDFGKLEQYNLYESGYSYLIIVSIPKFLEKLKESNTEYASLINNYLHILEYEFRGLDGIENITSDSSELTNGISNLNMITKVNQQSSSNFTMRYFEKSGSVLTKVNELFLRGIKDPRTQLKHYNGLIGNDANSVFKPDAVGYENETFSFLYMNTDNTGLELEKSMFIIGAQPTTAELSIYETEKGDIGFKEISMEFSGFPITGTAVDTEAKKVLNWINDSSNPNHIIRDSSNFGYTGISNIGNKAK